MSDRPPEAGAWTDPRQLPLFAPPKRRKAPAASSRPLRACDVPRATEDTTEATRGRCEWLWRSLVETLPGLARRRSFWTWAHVWVSERPCDGMRAAENFADNHGRRVNFLNAQFRRDASSLVLTAPITTVAVTQANVVRFAEVAAVLLSVAPATVAGWLWTGEVIL